ncbi:hypothetical protein [Dactylosporangium salmoneum]|uniref:DUF3558 domain-containing protein n=1 Tax=Dactylosporangium salmoneum TaxID=53361 RepID=A0ABP5UCJ3_9ACTN
MYVPEAAMRHHPVGRRLRLALVAALTSALAACASGPDRGPSPAPTGPPDAKTAMVCQNEAQEDIEEALGLPTSQPPTSTWQDRVYTCTYRYPGGVMLVSVKELPDAGAATKYFDEQQAAATSPVPFPDMGDAAFAVNNVATYVRKDRFVLKVDVSGLPEVLGEKKTPRNHVGIAVSSVILGCWVGD